MSLDSPKKSQKGHELNLIYTKPETYEDLQLIKCFRCSQEIIVSDGFYHCAHDIEDYHLGCLTNLKIERKSLQLDELFS